MTTKITQTQGDMITDAIAAVLAVRLTVMMTATVTVTREVMMTGGSSSAGVLVSIFGRPHVLLAIEVGFTSSRSTVC